MHPVSSPRSLKSEEVTVAEAELPRLFPQLHGLQNGSKNRTLRLSALLIGQGNNSVVDWRKLSPRLLQTELKRNQLFLCTGATKMTAVIHGPLGTNLPQP